MKLYLLPTLIISSLLINTCQSVTLIPSVRFENFLKNFNLPSNVPNEQIPTEEFGFYKEILVCATSCHQMFECVAYCFKNKVCVLVQQVGKYFIQSQNNDSEYRSMEYDCYLDSKYKLSDSDTILKAIGASNVALKKPVNASSLYDYGGKTYPGSLAVDGNFNQTYGNPPDIYCVVTDMELTPWIQIDLMSTFLVMYINITNNNNRVHVNRFHDVEVRVGFDNKTPTSSNTFTSNTICCQYNGIGDNYWFAQCMPKPILGKYVSFQVTRPCHDSPKCSSSEGNLTSMDFTEVQVYAFTP